MEIHDASIPGQEHTHGIERVGITRRTLSPRHPGFRRSDFASSTPQACDDLAWLTSGLKPPYPKRMWYRKAMAGSSGDRGAMCESVTRLDRHKPCRSEIR